MKSLTDVAIAITFAVLCPVCSLCRLLGLRCHDLSLFGADWLHREGSGSPNELLIDEFLYAFGPELASHA